MTNREMLIDDMRGMETVLCDLDDNAGEKKLTERQLIRPMASTLWNILNWIIRKIDEERSNK